MLSSALAFSGSHLQRQLTYKSLLGASGQDSHLMLKIGHLQKKQKLHSNLRYETDLRYGDRSVGPELYSVMHKLSSKYCMPKSQIESSTITTANKLFGRQWRCCKSTNECD